MRPVAVIFAITAATVAVSVTVSGSAQQAHAAERDVFRSGAWRGWSHYADKGGAFRYCGIQARYRSGITVSMLISWKGRFNLLFSKPEWRLTKGDTYPVIVRVDGAWQTRGNALAYSQDGVKVTLPTTARMVNILRGGARLWLITRQQRLSFSLAGSSDALARMVGCYAQAMKRKRETSDHPFGQSAKGGASKANPFGAGRASGLSRNIRSPARIIRAAGLSGYRGMPAADVTGSLGRATAVWTNGKVIGYLRLIYRKRPSGVGIETALAIAVAARNCKGRFTSGQRTAETSDRRRVMRFFTVCTSASGNRLLEANFIVRLSANDFALFGHYTSQDDDAVRDADNKIFAAAAAILNKPGKGTLDDADATLGVED